MEENKTTSVRGALLVGTNKSSRLAAMRAKALGAENLQTPVKKDQKLWATGLKAETKSALEQAEKLVDNKVAVVLSAYPKGKMNTFFKLKYGVKVDEINQMPRKEVFRLLGLETVKIKQFRLIENLDYNGNTVND
ncbi:MAG: hypothetical protein GQ532_20700 [Methylomarinum sp.]|nr:hypothetical protein [Methylomarinum sp.]